MERIVLADSGSPEAAAAISRLREKYGAEIVALTVDLGQGGEFEAIRNRALMAGAVRAHVLDAREDFARDFVAPALKADAASEGLGPVSRALGQALVARKLVDVAAIEQAAGVAIVDAGGGLSGLDVVVRSVAPNLPVIVASGEVALAGQETAPLAGPSPDTNLWGRSLEWSPEDPWTEAPETIYAVTKPAARCPDEAATVDLSFVSGLPTGINGVAMPLVELIGSLNTIAGRHGVGRTDTVRNLPGGGKARVIAEAPAAVVLHTAHQALQAFVTASDLHHVCRMISLRYAEVIDNGQWFTPTREALDAFVAKVQERVNGIVRLKLFKGDCRIIGRKSADVVQDRALAVALVADARRLVTM